MLVRTRELYYVVPDMEEPDMVDPRVAPFGMLVYGMY